MSHIGRYERCFSQPTADKIRKLARVLDVSGDYLLEGTTQESVRANVEDGDLLRMFKEVESLPAKEEEVVKILLAAFLSKQKLKELAAS